MEHSHININTNDILRDIPGFNLDHDPAIQA